MKNLIPLVSTKMKFYATNPIKNMVKRLILYHKEVQHSVGTLFEGICFETKEEVQHVLQLYHANK